MTWNTEEGTAGIIRSRRAAAASSIFILPSGKNIPKELPVSLQGGKTKTKQEFLEKLAALSQDIPAEEREAALEFYRDILTMRACREAEVIRELESPEKVAEQIKRPEDRS